MEEVVGLLLIFVTILYSLSMVAVSYSFFTFTKKEKKRTINVITFEDHVEVTLIIPMRNEDSVFLNLGNAINHLDYPASKLEILLIDDHSDSQQNLKRLLKEIKNFDCSLLSLPKDKTGKKAAISFGVDQAKGEIILCTDADCVFQKNWIQDMGVHFLSDDVQFVAGPVGINGMGFLNLFDSCENLAIQTLSFGLFQNKEASLCNGANMAFRKSWFHQVNGFSQNNHLASGDDVFLLKKAIELNKNSVVFSNSTSTLVCEQRRQTFLEWINRKKRWISKTPSLNSFTLNYFTGIIGLTNIILLIYLLFLPSNRLDLGIGVMCYSIKTIVDLLFIYLIAYHRKKLNLLLWYIIFHPIYLIYNLFIFLYSLFPGYYWKGRRNG